MAISRKTQKDVGRYQAKLVGPFTVKQSIFVGIAALVAMIVYKICDAIGVSSQEKITITLIVCIPIVLLGFLNPYGMSCMEFIRQYYEYHIRSSKIRPYVTVTEDELLQITEKNKPDEKGKKKPAKKKQGQNNAAQTGHKRLKEYPEYM